MRTRILFWFQIIMAWFYSIPQVISLINGRTKGLNLAIYVIFIIYLSLSLSLSISAYKNHKDEIRKQTIIIFSQWVIFIGIILLLGFERLTWSAGDTIVVVIIFILSIISTWYFHGIKHPYSKGFMAMWCKGIPQIWLACTILQAHGGGGLPLVTLVAGHATAIPRLFQIILSGKRGGWDKSVKGLMMGEGFNVITWIITTIAWFYVL